MLPRAEPSKNFSANPARTLVGLADHNPGSRRLFLVDEIRFRQILAKQGRARTSISPRADIPSIDLIDITPELTGSPACVLAATRRCIYIAKTLPRRDLEAIVLNDLGVLYLEQEDYEKADDQLLQSLKIHQSRNGRTESARLLLNMGVSSQRRGDAEHALDHFDRRQ